MKIPCMKTSSATDMFLLVCQYTNKEGLETMLLHWWKHRRDTNPDLRASWSICGVPMCLACPGPRNPVQQLYPLVCDRAGTATSDGTTELLGALTPATVPPGSGLNRSQWSLSSSHTSHRAGRCALFILHSSSPPSCNTLIFSATLFGCPIKSCTWELIFQSKHPCESPSQYTCINC